MAITMDIRTITAMMLSKLDIDGNDYTLLEFDVEFDLRDNGTFYFQSVRLPVG